MVSYTLVGGRRLPGRTFYFVAIFLFLFGGYLFYGVVRSKWTGSTRMAEVDHRLPPLYPALTSAEHALPQHNENLPFPEGRTAKFLRVGNQMWGVGLNNQLQEILLNTLIAKLSDRIYVFTPFSWDPFSNEPYVPVNPSNDHLAHGDKVRPAHTPLRAFIESPTSGEPWPAGDHSPRAVSDWWYDKMCPESKRFQVNATDVNPILGVDFEHDEGIDIVNKWAKYLGGLDHQCVNMKWDTPRIIDFSLLGSDRLLSLWPLFSGSPVLTHFKWSAIVRGAVERNLPALLPRSSRLQPLNVDTIGDVPGLVTLHVRRMDYEKHCVWMSGWAIFEGWNLLSWLPDRFEPPSSDEERKAYMVRRCWIEIDTIVQRLDKLRTEYPDEKLDRVFVSTNGGAQWTAELKAALKQEGWKSVMATSDLDLTWEESGVESAIDMELASRGRVFVGNGFSSFTSTIVSLRLSRKSSALYTRFW